MALGDKVRKLDIFKKVPKDISEGTNRGGFISLLTIISIGFFLVVEFKNYLRPDYQASIVTDQLFTRKEMKYPTCYVSGSTSTSHYPASPAKSSLSTSKTP